MTEWNSETDAALDAAGNKPVTTSPVTSSVQPDTEYTDSYRSLNRLYWFLAFLTSLVILRVFVPYFAEHLQYALTRGRERAEAEVATGVLESNPLEGLSRAYQLISKRVGPSVVHIQVMGVNEWQNDEFSAMFGPPVPRGEGSGVIIDSEGYVLTNNHVVRGAQKIRVVLSDGRQVAAQTVGTDAATDLAVLRVDANDLIAVEWGKSDDLEVGALVWAMGSPFGLQQSITFGILSAKNRKELTQSPYLDFLQTDAAVNPGNSGGPLVDARGRLIGINTAIVGDSYQGISFAIPSSVARRVYDRLRSRGYVDRGWLGVQLADVDLTQTNPAGVERGALVEQLSSASGLPSPAAEAGIRPGDIILKWNEKRIEDAATLQRQVALTAPGSKAKVEVFRRGRTTTLEVMLGERPRSF